MTETSERPWWHSAAAIVVVAAALLWPAWLNGQPLLFPDTIGYERAGVVALHVAGFGTATGTATDSLVAGVQHGRNGVSTVRSPFYGIPLAVLLELGGAWAAAAGQALIVAAGLVLATRRLGVPVRSAVPALGALIALGGVAMFSATLMPDVFLALMILGFALLLGGPALPRAETGYWLAVALAAMLFHKAFLAVAVGMTLLALLADRQGALRRSVLILLAAACTAGAAGHFVVEFAVKGYTGRESVGVPFLLARYAASPVLIAYLDDQCDVPRYALCQYRSRLPLEPDAFLWGPHNVFVGLSELERRAIAGEASGVLEHAIAARPIAAVAEALRGSALQFVTVGMDDYATGIAPTTTIDTVLAPTMQNYPGSRVARRSFPFALAGGAALGCYLIGFIGLAVALRRTAARPIPASTVFAATVVAGLVINAVISGALSGVFERYQGRVAWLVPYAAVVLLAGRAFRPRNTSRPA